MNKIILLSTFALCIIFMTQTKAQVGIGTTSPDNSAVLDLTATDKGFLVPRMTNTEMQFITSPADGLIIYNSTQGRLFFYNQFIGWTPVEGSGNLDPDRIVDADDGDTKVVAVDTGQFDYVLIEIEGTEFIKWVQNFNGDIRQQIESNKVFIGDKAGLNNRDGQYNTFIGGLSGERNTDGSANTFLGNSAGRDNDVGFKNTFIGEDAGRKNQLGSGNVALGEDALFTNKVGHSNVALGSGALYSNDSLSHLVAIGDSALYNNLSGNELSHGSSNTAVGSKALFENTIGRWNTAMGRRAMQKNMIGESNVAIGLNALAENTTGSENVVMGAGAQGLSSEGNGNVIIGYDANRTATSGDNNTIIGHRAGNPFTLHSKSGNVFLGYQAGLNETSNNKLYISNSDTNTPLIYGDFDSKYVRLDKLAIGRFAPVAKVHIDNNTTEPGILSEVSFTGLSDVIAIQGVSEPADGYGYGGYFQGGWRGVYGTADAGVSTITVTGVHGEAISTNGDTRAIYGNATGGVSNWAGYFEGGNVFVQNDVRIGSATGKSGYALSIDGKVVSEELKIEDSSNWPDYVFADEYELMPLQEVEASILKNKHLPGIPSAKEVEENGIMVGDMQKRMMEKIEELTLHIIALQKRIIEIEENNQ